MNKQEFDRAFGSLVGGVNSPVRSCKSVGGCPKFIIKGDGAYVWDAEGQSYIDYVGSFGASIAGHANSGVLSALQAVMVHGLGFSAPHPTESRLAEMILKHLPGSERIRFVNSGTEAVQTAIRLARGITGRSKVIKFSGCYHGHVDCMLVKAGSGALTLGQPNSAGVVVADQTIVAPYNDLPEMIVRAGSYSDDIAAVIVEPIAGNMGCILPKSGFLEGLRAYCDEVGALLIFDEVMTGFRVHQGSAQSLYQVQPDLTTLGKVIGGGLPIGAVTGSAEHMRFLAPEGPVYQAGTLSGNPMTMTAGIATLSALEPGYVEKLHAHSQELAEAAIHSATSHGVPLVANYMGGMWGIFFSELPVERFDAVSNSLLELFPVFYHAMMAEGIYWPPSAYEAVFISIKHDANTLAKTIKAFDVAFAKVAIAMKEKDLCT